MVFNHYFIDYEIIFVVFTCHCCYHIEIKILISLLFPFYQIEVYCGIYGFWLKLISNFNVYNFRQYCVSDSFIIDFQEFGLHLLIIWRKMALYLLTSIWTYLRFLFIIFNHWFPIIVPPRYRGIIWEVLTIFLQPYLLNVPKV